MVRVTLRDVATAADVNVATASRALSHDRSSMVSAATRARVVKAAEELGYRGNSQASSLRRGRTGAIGVVVADLSNPFIGPVLRGVENALGGRRLLPIMTETGDSGDELERVVNHLLAQRVDGLITTACRFGDRAFLKRVAKETPTVLAVRQLRGSGIPTITHDDVSGGRMAAEHLVSLGHRSIAQLMGPADIWSFAGRAEGFRAGATAAGATCLDVQPVARLPTIEAGRAIADSLLDQTLDNHPTAVFAHNDSMAIGAVAAFKARGLRCPHDISVIGYNDVPLTGYVDPPLTTVRMPAYELGRVAAELLVTLIDRTVTGANNVVFSPELVIRSSTRALGSVRTDEGVPDPQS